MSTDPKTPLQLGSGDTEFPCRLCGGGRLRPYFTLGNRGEFPYYKCPDCGLVNYDLRAGIDQRQYTSEYIDPTDDSARRNLDKDQSFAFIRRYLPEPGSMIDIGCGFGRLLHVARRAGWSVKGLELSGDVAERVAKELDVEVAAGDFLEVRPFPGETFDLVCLRHVLEHLPDSLGAMDRIRNLLKAGGHVLLEMPNIEALDKRLKRGLVNAGLHRRRFADDFLPGHCNEFCRDSMQYLLDRSGFELVRWETYSKKPVSNFLYNRLHVGNKARVLARVKD